MSIKRILFVVLVASVVVLAVGVGPRTAGMAWALPLDQETDPGGITLTLTTPALKITKDDDGSDTPQIEGFYPSASPGDPALPARIYNVALPPDVDWSSVTVEVLHTETVEWPGTYEIAPALPMVSWGTGQEFVDWGENAAHIVDGKNVGVYQDDVYFPSSPVTLSAYAQMRKWRYVRLLFMPVQYNPVSGKLQLATEVEVRVAFERYPSVDVERLQDELGDTAMDDRAALMLYNYEQAKAWYQVERAPTTPQADYYVIITRNEIVNDSVVGPQLDAFIAHKQNLGWTVGIVTQDQYGALAGDPLCQAPCGHAEQIRLWLQQNYLSLGVVYVLLIGDPDPDDPDLSSDDIGDVPMKMMYPRPDSTPGDRGNWCYAQVANDYFYADLTGNWDLNGNGDFGEWEDWPAGDKGVDDQSHLGVDFEADVWVGRILVYRKVAGWQTTLVKILQKTMDYETSGDLTWRRTVLLPMSFTNGDQACDPKTGQCHPIPITDGAYMAEAMKADYLDSAGYTSYTLYQQAAAGCDSVFNYPDMDEELLDGAVAAHWQQHDYGIVLWFAHGGSEGAGLGYGGCPAACGGILLESKDAPQLDNDHPAFVYHCSCLNGYPESVNNLGYALLTNGAIGTVSASRCSGYGMGVFASNPNVADNRQIGYEFMQLLTEGYPAGYALYQGKGSLGHVALGDWMNPMLFNLYGDPSVHVNSGHPMPPDAPGNLVATSVPYNQIDLTWTDNSDNETDFTIMRSTDGQSFEPLHPSLAAKTTAHRDAQNLTCGTTYYYKVVANNAYGNSESNMASAPALMMDDFEPDDTYGTAKSFIVNHFPQARTFHAEGDEDWIKFTTVAQHAYYIRGRAGAGTENLTALELYDTDGTSLLAESIPCTIGSSDSCINGWIAPVTGTYYLRVRNSFNLGGCTGYDYDLEIWESAYPSDLPVAPSDLTATPNAHDRISLTWTDNSDNEDGFKIERWGWQGIGIAQWQQIGTVGTDVTTYNDTGLTCNTHYRYRVRAYNAEGDSYYSPSASATTPAEDAYDLEFMDDDPANAAWITLDGTPQVHTFHDTEDVDWVKFTATAGRVYTITTANLGIHNDTVLGLYDSDGATLLTWNDDCGSSEASCIRWIAGSSGIYYVQAHSIDWEGGCPGYEYELAAIEASGNPAWPAAPSNLVATAVSQTQIDLTWADNSGNEEGFKIERWGIDLPPYYLPLWQEIFIAGPGVTTYSDVGLTCNTNYRYRMRAYNASGDSGYSHVANATTAYEDAYEPDDDELTAGPIVVNGGPQTHNFHVAGDEDWAGFAVTMGEVYTITTSGLFDNVDTILRLYYATLPEVILVAENDNCISETLASCIEGWVAPNDGLYLVRVLSNGETGGCPGYGYDLTVVDSNLGDVLPPPPDDLVATTVSPYQINLSWADSGMHLDSGETDAFLVERRYGNDWIPSARVEAGVTSYKDSGLYCGLTYEYRVGAYNASGISDYAIVSATTADCPGLQYGYQIYLPLIVR